MPVADSAVAEAVGPTLVTSVAGTEAVAGLVVAAVPTGSVAVTGTVDGTVDVMVNPNPTIISLSPSS